MFGNTLRFAYNHKGTDFGESTKWCICILLLEITDAFLCFWAPK